MTTRSTTSAARALRAIQSETRSNASRENGKKGGRPRKGTKRDRALEHYNGHQGASTVGHVEKNIESVWPTAYQDLTGDQYGKLMSVANASYHDGKIDAGAWRDSGLIGFDDVCVPAALLELIRKVERVQHDYKPIEPGGGQDPLSHLSGPRDFFRKLPGGEYEQITSRTVPGTEYWSDWQRAQRLLPGQLYLRETWHTTDYYIGDNLIYSESA